MGEVILLDPSTWTHLSGKGKIGALLGLWGQPVPGLAIQPGANRELGDCMRASEGQRQGDPPVPTGPPPQRMLLGCLSPSPPTMCTSPHTLSCKPSEPPLRSLCHGDALACAHAASSPRLQGSHTPTLTAYTPPICALSTCTRGTCVHAHTPAPHTQTCNHQHSRMAFCSPTGTQTCSPLLLIRECVWGPVGTLSSGHWCCREG